MIHHALMRAFRFSIAAFDWPAGSRRYSP